MPAPNKRSTICFEPELHRALRLKAASTSRSISEIVDDALYRLVFKRSVAKDLRAIPKAGPAPGFR